MYLFSVMLMIRITMFPLKLDDPISFKKSLRKMSDSAAEIKAWMTQNKLKLNDAKTEVLIIVPTSQCSKYPSMDVKIADATVETAIFYTIFAIYELLASTSHKTPCEKLVHALISSRLDYANSILVGLPKRKICRLQSILNIAAQIITKTREIWSHHSHTTFIALITSRITYPVQNSESDFSDNSRPCSCLSDRSHQYSPAIEMSPIIVQASSSCAKIQNKNIW